MTSHAYNTVYKIGKVGRNDVNKNQMKTQQQQKTSVKASESREFVFCTNDITVINVLYYFHTLMTPIHLHGVVLN
jgi:hypothetical protein